MSDAAHKAEQPLQVQAEGLTDAAMRLAASIDPTDYFGCEDDIRLVANAILAARPQAAEPQDERARFEAWATGNYYLERSGGNNYDSEGAQDAWEAWQAALAPAAAGGGGGA